MRCLCNSAPRGTSALRLSRAFFLSLLVWGAALSQPQEGTLVLENGQSLRYELLDASVPEARSARRASEQLLRHLAAGRIEDAALLSTAPRRRYEELAKYAMAVGEHEFKRVFQQYLAAGAPMAEVAIGRHRLLIWELAEAGHHLSGQYFVEVDGRFLLDDVPNETRSRLRRILEAYRSGRITNEPKS
jgi:hypothetical protein